MEIITKEMIDNYHHEMGEDFVDQNEHMFNGSILLGFYLAKKPELNIELTQMFNENKGKCSIQDIQEIVNNEDIFYIILIEYINLASDGFKNKIIKILK